MWFIQNLSFNEPISGPLIYDKTVETNTKFGGPEDFKANSDWLHNENPVMEYVSYKLKQNYYQLIQVALNILNKHSVYL